jgi:DNA-nicking Smr family endonuclease
MVTLLKVFELFKDLTDEQQSEIVHHWMSGKTDIVQHQAQTKPAAKAAAMVPSRNQMRYTKDEVSEVDSHLSEGRGPTEIARIMNRKYPKQMTLDAWEKMANRVRKVGVEAMIQRAVDVEFRS